MVLTLKDLLGYIFDNRANSAHIRYHEQRYLDIGTEWRRKHSDEPYKLMDRGDDGPWRSNNNE
jgi:hypothetical protein